MKNLRWSAPLGDRRGINLNEFYKAFDVTEKDALWLAPAERVRIW
ncbi:MAG: hypothetical protein WCJ91_03055 [Actinomycetes bacterium]